MGFPGGGMAISNITRVFQTDSLIPEVSVFMPTDISWNTATFHGKIINNNYPLYDHGFIYDISADTIDHQRRYISLGEIPEDGFFEKKITDLVVGASYNIFSYVKSIYSGDSSNCSPSSVFMHLPYPPAPRMKSADASASAGNTPWSSAVFYGKIAYTNGARNLAHHGFIWTTTFQTMAMARQDPSAGLLPPAAGELQLSNREGILDLGKIGNTAFPNDGEFNFQAVISNLQPLTKYFCRSFASFSPPVGYGPIFTYITPEEPCECFVQPPPLPSAIMGGCGVSSKMKCAQFLKLKTKGGGVIVSNQGKTPNLPGGRGKCGC